MTIDRESLAAIEKRAGAATEGPWQASGIEGDDADLRKHPDPEPEWDEPNGEKFQQWLDEAETLTWGTFAHNADAICDERASVHKLSSL